MSQQLLTQCYRVVESQLNDADMSLTVGFGTRAWCDATRRLRGRVSAPTFEPEFHREMTAYHLRIDHASYGIVALAACRRFAGEFLPAVQSGALWYEINAPAEFMTCNILSDELPELRNVAFLGGLWVSPVLQGCGIGGALSMINKLTALARWPETTCFTATIREQNFAKVSAAGRSYLKEYEASAPLWRGYYPPTENIEMLHLATLGAEVILARANPTGFRLSVQSVESSPDASRYAHGRA